MYKIINVTVAFVASWLFFFPITFTFLPSTINSKMMMAVIGILIVIFNILTGKQQHRISKSLLVIILIATIFSIICYFSVVINGTNEKAYTTYIISMLVWLSAAYTANKAIEHAHNYTSIRLISNYIIALCSVQCVVALLIYLIPALNTFVHTYTLIPTSASWESRLIGLGIAYDTAGSRFSAALIICAAMICDHESNTKSNVLYFISFIIISIVGNMLSRTTIVGISIAVIYFLYKSKFWEARITPESVRNLKIILGLAVITIAIIVPSYRIFPKFSSLIDFGFEGFINFIENGKWETHSSSILQGMWSTWPDNLKTWIIGDGYFADPDDPLLFYMGTDVGYARLIFYCGILGFAVFASLFVYLTITYIKRHSYYASLFIFLLLIVFSVWIKVSTDIFLIFAFYFFIQSTEQSRTLLTNETSI